MENLRKLTLRLAQITFGILLPMWLVWAMLLSHYRVQRVAAVEQSFDQLAQSLDRLENYHDDRVFFHALLQKNFQLADHSVQPQQQLEKKIAAFRRMFKGRLRFIVYDKHGGIVRHLTDEARFQYILKAMFSTIHELQRLYLTSTLNDPSGIDTISGKLELLRGYFGQFLLQKLMFEPLKADYLGKCLFVSEDPEKRLLWYYPGTNFSLACFIDAALLDKEIGPRLIIRRFNSRSGRTRLAFLKLPSYESAGLPGLEPESAEIKIEARNFESYAVSSRESRNFLVHFRQVSPEMIVLSYMRVSHLPGPETAATGFLIGLAKWLILAVFLLCCLRLRFKSAALSVQQKIMLLFLFANGLPLLMLISTGYEFFNEKKKDLINATHQESVRILKEFDVRFPEVSESLAQRLNVFIDERNGRYGPQKWPDHEIKALLALTKEINPQEAMIYDTDGNDIFHLSDSLSPSKKMVKDLFLRALDFYNSDQSGQMRKGRNSLIDQVSSNDLILHDFLWFIGRFKILSTGDVGRLSYIRLLGGGTADDPTRFSAWGTFGLSWDPVLFMRTFIAGKLNEVAAEAAPRQLMVFEKQSEEIFAARPLAGRDLRRLLRQTSSRKLVTHENVMVGGSRYLFTSISGNEIAEGILAALYPSSIIEQKIRVLQYTIFSVGLLLAFTLIQIVRFFSRRLLVPVEALGKGIERMRRNDFDYRISYQAADEFGELVSTFNRTLSGMKELAVGTAVQESLLPEGTFSSGNTRLFARSLFMSKMGGDYYDYFNLPGGRLGIFFGDVAGHGIPAAMIMAMAKAVITAAARDFTSPSAVLTSTSQVLLELKKRNWRRMMTALCFDYNLSSGGFSFANAGHCYPVVVGPGGRSVAMIEMSGMPLGSSSKKPYESVAGRLLPGETLVLYTDGIVEATSLSGQMFDYHRFLKLLQTGWSEDLEVYWQNIYEGYKAWAVSQDDDLTFLMLRLEENHE